MNKRSGYIEMAAIGLLLVILLLLTSCADPSPFEDGSTIPTPHQCDEAHKRGHSEC